MYIIKLYIYIMFYGLVMDVIMQQLSIMDDKGFWLVVWKRYMFPYIGNNDPNRHSYFSAG